MEKKNWLEQLKDFEHSNQENPQPKRRFRQFPAGNQFWKKPIFLASAGVILLVFIISLVLITAGGKQDSPQNLQEIFSRLEQMENQLAMLENRISDQEQEMHLIQEADTKLSQGLQEFGQDLKNMQEELQSVSQDLSKQESRAQTEPAVPEDTDEDTDYIYHEVQPGENLYRISQSYETSVQKIRELNGLGPDEPILPGQRLKVGSRQ